MSSIVDFKFVPWGNGKIETDGQMVNTTNGLSALLSQLVVDGDQGRSTAAKINFYCQHGGAECAGNAYESCTQVRHGLRAGLRKCQHADHEPPSGW